MPPLVTCGSAQVAPISLITHLAALLNIALSHFWREQHGLGTDPTEGHGPGTYGSRSKGNCVQVLNGITPSAAIRRLTIAIALAMAFTFLIHTVPASAITREQVIKRANTWVKKKVPYSQSGYYKGYRRDCSGMVSMAWKLKRSYTSRTLGSVARRVSKSKLRPGDVIHTPGHVAIFGGWANKSHTKYIAIQQSGRGKPANKRVKTWRRGATALRLRGIKNNPPKKRTIAVVKPAVIVPAATILPATAPAALPVAAPFN